MIKLCIFDLDGTVADTLNSIAYFANKALNKYGFDSFDVDEYKYFVGDGADKLIKRITAKAGGNEEDFHKIKNEYMTTYVENCTYLTKPYDGIIELLENLKEKNITSVIFSNKPQEQADRVADALFKNGLIKECIGGKDNIPLKPDPTVLEEIIIKYDVKKEECLFIGDTKTDMMTANNANVKSVGVLWGFRDEKELREHNATYIVKNPNEIMEKILL